MKSVINLISELQTRQIKLWVENKRLRYAAPPGVMTDDVRKTLRSHKEEIIEFLGQLENNKARTIQPVQRTDNLPLSFAQKRLWLLNQIEGEKATYNISMVLDLTGHLDLSVLEKAFSEIVDRHESLRTNFQIVDEEIVQVISDEGVFKVDYVNVSPLAEGYSSLSPEIENLINEETRRPFDLAIDSLFRVKVFCLGEDHHILALILHHIISDGWSMGVLRHEFKTLYEAFSKGQPSPLEPLSIQYADFSHWQQELLSGDRLKTQLTYWRQKLVGLPPLLELPTDRPRPPVQTFAGSKEKFQLSPQLTHKLKQLSQQSRSTLFMTLLSAFSILLGKYGRATSVAIGSPIANRQRSELENLIGCFVNTLVYRIDLDQNLTFNELLVQVRKTATEAYEHQDLPFEKLVEELQPERTLSYNPLFQVMFALQNAPKERLDLPDVTISSIRHPGSVAKFDLTLTMSEVKLRPEKLAPYQVSSDRPPSTTLRGTFSYNTDLFDESTIRRLIGHFETLLKGIVANPEQSIGALPLLTASDYHQLVVEWNNTQTKYPYDKFVHQLFEEQVERTPESVAVVFEDNQLTYKELNIKANQLAYHLQTLGVKPGMLVGVCINRSFELIIGLLAILKAGGVYVPLDVSYPLDRLAFMLEETNISVLVTTHRAADRFNSIQSHLESIVYLDTDLETINKDQVVNPTNCSRTTDLAYVMYTSGSTGKPKGVSIRHQGIVRLVRNTNYATITADDVFLQLAPVAFDAATLEIWGALLNGAQLVLFSDTTPTPETIGQVVAKHQVTLLWLTAGLFHLMVDHSLENLQSLRYLLAGGDILSISHVQQAVEQLPNCTIINGYGPTENTTFTCCYPVPCPVPMKQSIPIGRPIANTQVYILDSQQQPVPIGIPGELYIGGDGLATGYFNRPELTLQRFIPNPFKKQPGTHLYKTGDLVRYLSDGTIEFLGRLDNQVKLRGFRIELGEIETLLLEQPDVKQSVVIAREDTPGDKRLVAYVVPPSGQLLDTQTLRQTVKDKLPDYMVPSQFVLLDTLPLTPNGKLDRRALPAPDPTQRSLDNEFIAPRIPLEEYLCKIWCNLLKLEQVGIYDDFFELGGHSLLAVELFTKIEKTFGKKLPLATLFQASTIKEIAQVIRQQDWLAPWESLVAIKSGGTKLPLFYMHGGGGNLLVYRDLAIALGNDQPVYGLQPRGLDGKLQPSNNIKEMAEFYISQIRQLQPKGPYYLAGLSIGGTIAWEMAKQLKLQGEDVALLALFDTPAPGATQLLPLWPRIISVLIWFGMDTVHRVVKQPGQLLDELKQEGWKSSFMLLAKKLRLVKPIIDSDSEAISKIVDRQTNERLNRYKEGVEQFSWLENWLNLFIVSLLKRSSKGYYANIFASGLVKRVKQNLPSELKLVEKANAKARKSYKYEPLDQKAILFRATERAPGLKVAPDLGWQKLALKGLEIYEIKGNHVSITRSPVLATRLKRCLNNAQAQNNNG